MAKLNAPLFSFNASGKIANALVYFCWKGIDVVRSYVVPSNPKSDAQKLQRGYLKAAVTKIHAAQAHPTVPFGANDATSYALLGSTYPTPRTWFNSIVKQWLDQKRLGKIPAVYSNGSCTSGTEKITLKSGVIQESGTPTSGKVYYGTSRTALINSIDCTIALLAAGKEIPNLSKGVKYFCQFRATTPTTFEGTNSGIWHSTAT